MCKHTKIYNSLGVFRTFDEQQCENLLDELEMGPRSFTDFTVKKLVKRLPAVPSTNSSTITELGPQYIGCGDRGVSYVDFKAFKTIIKSSRHSMLLYH